MQVVFKNEGLEQMDRESDFHGDFEPTATNEFRHRLQILRSADSEQRLLLLKALDMQRFTENKTNYRMRVTDKFRLELEFRDGEPHRDRCVVVTGMTSNHNDNRGNLS